MFFIFDIKIVVFCFIYIYVYNEFFLKYKWRNRKEESFKYFKFIEFVVWIFLDILKRFNIFYNKIFVNYYKFIYFFVFKIFEFIN